MRTRCPTLLQLILFKGLSHLPSRSNIAPFGEYRKFWFIRQNLPLVRCCEKKEGLSLSKDLVIRCKNGISFIKSSSNPRESQVHGEINCFRDYRKVVWKLIVKIRRSVGVCCIFRKVNISRKSLESHHLEQFESG